MDSKETIKDRKLRGNAMLSLMCALLSDIPLGKWRTETGISLRQSWFINGCLFNSEVWLGLSPQDLHDLNVIDHKILRLITGAQEKVPVEMLFLETGELPIKHVISVRRLMYLHTILKRNTNKITRKIYSAMKEDPIKGDWINLVKVDLEVINLSLEDEREIENMTSEEFKVLLKRKFRDTAFQK